MRRLVLFLHRMLEDKGKADLVALDFDAESIKLLKLNSSETPHKVEKFAVGTLPANAIVRNEIKDENAVLNTLKDLFRKTGAKTTAIALAIPRSSALIKNVTYDKRFNESEIESRAWVEANRNFPDLVGEIYLDFATLPPTPTESPTNEMVIVACRKEQIDPYLEVLKKANLTPRILDINSYALQRALYLLQEEKTATYGLLNLNLNTSTLIVSQDDNLLYAHDDTYEGNRLKTQINEFQKSTDKGPADYTNPNYQAILRDSLSAHLRHAMHFFYSSRPHVSVTQLFVSGDFALYPGLPEFVQNEIGIPTQLAKPLAKMKIDDTINEELIKKYEPALMLCCGLALSQFK